MKLQRFFINDVERVELKGGKTLNFNSRAEELISGSSQDIDEQLKKNSELTVADKNLSEQIRKVFRMKKGGLVALLDNSGISLEAEIVDFGKDTIDFSVSDREVSSYIPEREVWLYVSIPKKDKFELIVQKATELGVSHIVPVISERTEKQNIKWERVEKIAKEASEQSARGVRPVIHETESLRDILESFKENNQKDNVSDNLYALHMSGEKKFSEIKNIPDGKSVGVLVGPEGGWGELDMKLFTEYETPLVSLGDQVLRAETASISVASLLLLE
jgi:16S rRNA (uracil1498-N3)-methyltransferase